MELNQKDIAVIKAAQKGDVQAFTEIYEKYHRLAYYIAFKLCHNQADAQDIVQETFLDIQHSIVSLREPQYFKVWFYRVVSNKCKKMFRKNQHIESDYDGSIAANATEERREFIPNKQLRFDSDRDVFLRFIDELNPAQKEVVILFYLEQLSLKEIAQITGTIEGTVKSRLSYARKYLHEALLAYQEKEHEPITFTSLDTLLMTAIAYEASTFVKLPFPIMKQVPIKHLTKLSHALPQILIGSCLTVVVAQGVRYSYDTWHSEANVQQEVLKIRNNAPSFQSISFQNEEIDNARDAYFLLMNWACCEDEIERKPMPEIQERLHLYEELKRCGGAFYEYLQKDNWNTAFENRINTKNKNSLNLSHMK